MDVSKAALSDNICIFVNVMTTNAVFLTFFNVRATTGENRTDAVTTFGQYIGSGLRIRLASADRAI
jgi:hypothetical protein